MYWRLYPQLESGFREGANASTVALLATYQVASDDASMVNDKSAVRHTGRDLIACLDGSLSRFGTCNNINAT